MRRIINLIIMIGVLIYWASAKRRAAQESGRRRTRRPTDGSSPHTPPSPSGSGADEDLVWGTRPLRHPPSQSGQAKRPARVRAADMAMPSARGKPKKPALGQSLASSQAEGVTSARRRGHPWERLGVERSPAGLRQGLRRAILLREVLGPPRALRGPAGRKPAGRR